MLGIFNDGTPVAVPRACNACNQRWSRAGVARRSWDKSAEDGDDNTFDTVYVVHDPTMNNDNIECRVTGNVCSSMEENVEPGR